jgi:CobQ-like glutamine amidotransferase family enzyme
MSESAVRIALVYPALLGTYGDGGNASVLAQRLRWRGREAETIDVGVDEALPAQADVYVLGGGEDTAQTLAVSRLERDGGLHRAAEGGKPVFAVCAGFQILGTTFLDGQGRDHPGLGLIDCRTDRLPGPRAVGELLADPQIPGMPVLTGYENHGGRTVLGPAARPLGRVRDGVGNGDGTDGAVQGSVVATYLHGPALARNPALADHLLELVVGDLPPLDDREEEELRRERLAAVRRARVVRRRQWRPSARS